MESALKRAKRPKPGRPPALGEDRAETTLRIRMSASFRARIVTWGKNQPDEPTESEAARRLLDKSLTRDGY